jgi:hypothetical protein
MYVEIFFSSNRAAKREEQEVGTVFKQERKKKGKEAPLFCTQQRTRKKAVSSSVGVRAGQRGGC